MATITKNLTTDFGGSINLLKLRDEINANVVITTICNAVTVDYGPGDVKIEMAGALSAPEMTELNDVVMVGHDSTPSVLASGDLENIHIGDSGSHYFQTTSATYVEVRHFIHNPNKKVKEIIVNAWVDAGSGGCVRLATCTTDMTIAEITGMSTTNDDMISAFGTLSNLPTMEKTKLKIEIKNTDGNATRISDLGTIYSK